jgi:hypothetical protein
VTYWLARLLFQRALAGIYLVAFLVAVNQFRPLLGERGLLPVPRFVRGRRFRDAPSVFTLRYSDRLFMVVAWAGVVLSLAALAGVPDHGPAAVGMAIWIALWALYLSIVNVGQTFYSFGWESLLVEAGFLAVFLGPARWTPPMLVIWLLRWLVFRLEFGAGLIKLRGDPCWRDLTCLYYHHETQPMPNPLSWWFHNLPRSLHRVEVAANHAAQLVVPFGLFAPQPVADIAGAIIVVTQSWLIVSGNFSWLNFLTITAALSAFDNRFLAALLPLSPRGAVTDAPTWHEAMVLSVFVIVVVLSWWPVRNLASRRQRMNASFNRLHLVNSYGAFGSITRTRHEIVIEGTREAEVGETEPAKDGQWEAYEFKGKPGDPKRRPPQVAPYHLRLDWLMWFAALSPGYASGWFDAFIVKLLEGDRATLKLLRHNPFPDAPPAWVRARFFRYRFTTRKERKQSGAVWDRTPVGDYLPPVRLPAASRSSTESN